jgi:hypothetical protein
MIGDSDGVTSKPHGEDQEPSISCRAPQEQKWVRPTSICPDYIDKDLLCNFVDCDARRTGGVRWRLIVLDELMRVEHNYYEFYPKIDIYLVKVYEYGTRKDQLKTTNW